MHVLYVQALYHGSWVIWVMSQVFSGSHGSLEVTHHLPWVKAHYSMTCVVINILVAPKGLAAARSANACIRHWLCSVVLLYRLNR